MRPIRLSRYLLLVLGFFLLFTPSCTRQTSVETGGHDGGGTRAGGPRHDTYDEAIGVYLYDEAGAHKAKANPPVKHVSKRQDVYFYTDGCSLVFSPNNSTDLFPNPPAPLGTNQWKATVGDKPGLYKYAATCNGIPVEGNSPPIIIVDP